MPPVYCSCAYLSSLLERRKTTVHQRRLPYVHSRYRCGFPREHPKFVLCCLWLPRRCEFHDGTMLLSLDTEIQNSHNVRVLEVGDDACFGTKLFHVITR